MAIDIIEDLQNASLDRPLKGLLMENGLHIFATKQDILDEQAISKGRVANAVIFARDIKKWLVFDENGENYEEKENPGATEETNYRDTAVLDHVESIGFDENKKATIDNPQDQRFMFVDLPTRLYNSGDADITLDSSKPIGVIQLENFANYNWDYPEIIVRLYVDSDSTYLGGFRIPYGFGAVVKYNLNNKSENNLSKGYWTWSMFVVDWSVVQKVATSEGQFASVETAYLGLFGDEGEDDERVFYPAMFKQDVNGWTQFEFTANMQFKSKNKDSGVVGDKVLELQPSKVVNHKQPFYGDDKLATRTNNHITNTFSFNDLIHSSGMNINEWIADNDGYTPQELLGAIYDSKVLGSTNWIVSATTSGNDYNGTFPNGFQQVELHRSGGSSRNFMRAYNKESTTHYFSPYKANTDPTWKKYTFDEDVPGLVDIELEPIEERLTNLESGGNLDTNYIESEFKFSDSPEDGYTQSVTDQETQNLIIRGQVINAVKIPEETKGALAFGVIFKDNGRFFMGFHAELIGELVGMELMNKRPNLGIVFDTSKFNPCLKQGSSTPGTGIMNWEGYCIPKGMDANDDSPARYIMPDGSQTTVKADAFTREYMDWNLNQRDTFVDSNGFTEDWKYRLSRGYIASNGSFIPEESSPYYFCRMGMQYSYSVSKISTLSFVNGTFSIYQTPAGAIADREKVATVEEVSTMINGNNDEIIAPVKGDQFQLVDSEKSSSYGNASKQVSYFQPTVGTQSDLLLSKLDYGKSFAIHEEVNSTKLIMILHESLVAEIYNRDLTGINELTMLFTGDSRGRLAKANQTAAAQFAINWNGELIPATEDANELNPSQWVAQDDSVTESWSTSVKSVCYSSGILANRGSAMLKRGDVIYSKPETLESSDELLLETPRALSNALLDSGETATITYDNNSEFFVMPIVAGGGTFGVMKVFQLFMSRKKQYVEDWGSIRFEQSSDCIGTILKISYDAAIAQEEADENIQEALFKMAVDSQNEYGTQLVVDLTGD